jgi:hypothetical protein
MDPANRIAVRLVSVLSTVIILSLLLIVLVAVAAFDTAAGLVRAVNTRASERR